MDRFSRNVVVPYAASVAFYLVAVGATMSAYTNVPIAIGCFVVATGLFAFAGWHAITEWHSASEWGNGTNSFSRKISLRDAATQLYNEFRGTPIGGLLEGTTDASWDDILNNAAHHILQHLPLQVKQPRSTRWKRLPRSEVGGLTVCGGGTGLTRLGHSHIIYAESRLMREDLAQIIREYKAVGQLRS